MNLDEVKTMSTYKQISTAINMAMEIQALRDFYPALCEYNKIKRLLKLADTYMATMEGAKKNA